jgi:phosphoadenosine phosphosulfate reductase
LTALFRNGEFIDDAWRLVSDGEDVPPSGHVIVPLDWWLAQRGAFEGSRVPMGVLVEPGVKVETYADDIPRFTLIALSFPKFQDGRNFSTAQILRGRYGFAGELRAVGDVLLDQLQLMQRCGFDSFEISDAATIAALREGRGPRLSRFYQPSLAREAPAGTRPWLRQPA